MFHTWKYGCSLYSNHDYYQTMFVIPMITWHRQILDHSQQKIGFFLHFYLFIYFISWRLITLQYFSGFCHTVTWISHGYTCIPHPNPSSHLPLHPIPLGLPSAPGPSTCLERSKQDRHFVSGIIKCHSCSALLMPCLYFLSPKHYPMVPNIYFVAVFLFQQRQP